jgi:hypothetical protein
MAIKDGVFGRNLEEGDVLYVDIPENHYKVLDNEMKSDLNEDEIDILQETVDIKKKDNPSWGIY